MKSFQCRHDLVHVFERHECDGCCAQVRLEPAQKPFKMSLSDCKKHNWVYDEFDEPCPLCEAVNAEHLLLMKLTKEVLDDLFYKPDATVENVMVGIARKWTVAKTNE